jgi:hypothetical protein
MACDSMMYVVDARARALDLLPLRAMEIVNA